MLKICTPSNFHLSLPAAKTTVAQPGLSSRVILSERLKAENTSNGRQAKEHSMKDSLKNLTYRAGSGAVSSTLLRAVNFGQALEPDAKEVKQASDWVKAGASSTAEKARRLGKEAMKSELVKDAAWVQASAW